VLNSSQGEEPSYVRKDKAMSIFTYHLIEALTGHAQPQEGATDVLVSDVMSYVWRKVPESARQDWGRDQHPDYQVSGNFPVALLLGGQGWSKGLTAPDPLETSTAALAAGPKTQVNVGSISNISGGEVNIAGGDIVKQTVQTGGGAYIAGPVNTGGGNFVGGDNISVGNISGSTGVAIGRNAQSTVTYGMSSADVAYLFQPVLNAIRNAQPDQRDQAQQKLEELQGEVSKGKGANDKLVARLIDGLVELVPGAVGALVSTFASPVLAAMVGPATEYVLDKIRGQ
jgi:hypothetical protein